MVNHYSPYGTHHFQFSPTMLHMCEYAGSFSIQMTMTSWTIWMMTEFLLSPITTCQSYPWSSSTAPMVLVLVTLLRFTLMILGISLKISRRCSMVMSQGLCTRISMASQEKWVVLAVLVSFHFILADNYASHHRFSYRLLLKRERRKGATLFEAR